MIEGRSGGSGRGTRRESWAPPDSGSAHRRIAGLYRVPDSRPEAVPRRPRISFPPPLPHPSHRLLATGKNSAAPKRTFSSALVSAGWRAQRENDRRKERGIWAGHSKRIVGPRSQVCIVYPTLGPKPFRAALAFPSLRRFLTRRTACWPRGKIPPHPSARSARHSSPQDGGPKGKMIEGRSGGSGRGTRRESWAPPDSGSAHRRIAGLYRVPTLDPSRSLRRPAFPSLRRFLTLDLPAGPREKFRRARTT